MSLAGILLAAALGVPTAALIACLWSPVRDFMPRLLWLLPLPALAAAGFALFGEGPPPALTLDPGRLRIGLALDTPGAVLLGVAALLWTVAGIYASVWLRGAATGSRHAIYWLLTLIGSLGVFAAADLATFYLVFALVSLPAWGLVVYDSSAQARRAGGVYLLLAVLGEVCLLLGFVMLASASPGDSLAIGPAVAALAGSPWRDLALGLLIAGFGVKIGLVPLHIWMPLAYTAAPIPAAAVLSGAAVKAGVIGLIRFLPFESAAPDWGGFLTTVGLIGAFYGVAVGIAQQNPKTVLAYSSVSQMGLIAAAFGLGWAAGDPSAISPVTLYAADHLLVKGALFLGLGVAAATGVRRLWPVLIPLAILALGLAGLPLTGGALAKLAVKPLFGVGLAGLLGALGAAGSTLLMLHFLRRLAASAAPNPADSAPLGLALPWWLMLAAALVIPWALAPFAGLGHWSHALLSSLAPDELWNALWPMLLGVILFLALWRWGERLPQVPEGDLLAIANGAGRGVLALGAGLERADGALRQWPIAGISLLALALCLWAAVLAALH